MDLKLTQKQRLLATQQMIQSVEILQMTIFELSEYLAAEAEENPMLDMDALYETGSPITLLWKRDCPDQRTWERQLHAASASHDDARMEPHTDALREETLELHLWMQLLSVDLSEEERRICRYLIGCVDVNGYLDEDAARLASRFGVSICTVDNCLKILRSLDPPGVCAENMEMCLLRQLPEQELDALTAAIIRFHLNDLAHGHYSGIAKAENVSVSKVRDACEKIKRLSPFPSAGFSTGDEVFYLRPDAELKVEDGQLVATLCNTYAPYLKINRYYAELLERTEDAETQAYLKQKYRAADVLVQNIRQRDETLLKCVREIAEIQRAYFIGEETLVPMTLAMVAERVGVQTSTISRTIRGKYLQCSKGVLPLKGFFTHGIEAQGSATVSAQSIQEQVRQLVDGEDKHRPLSDQMICELLQSQGYTISRRAVAKYREQMNIPSSFVRKM